MSQMLGYMSAGLMITLCAFAFMARINMRRCLGYNNVIDIIFTVLMIYMLHSTYSGIVAGAFAGIVMSLGLYALRRVMGYERLQRNGRKLKWVYTAPMPFLPSIPNIKSWLSEV